MINLLPPIEKETLLTEKKKRMAIILWFLFIFFLICLSLIMFSVKIYLQSQIEVQKSDLAESEKQFLESETQELQDQIKLINLVLLNLDSFYSQKVYFSEILENISSTLPDNFYLTNLSMAFSFKQAAEQEPEEKAITASLSGFAPLREDLLEFKDNLEQKQDFKEIYFPASNWVEAYDINFNATFKIPL